MQTYDLIVRNRTISPMSSDNTLVRTSVGVDRVRILADEEWMGYDINVAFENGALVSVPATPSETDYDGFAVEVTVEVPPEVLETVGPLQVTLYGVDGDRYIITRKSYPLTVVQEGDGARP
jgi:hypothetical protein